MVALSIVAALAIVFSYFMAFVQFLKLGTSSSSPLYRERTLILLRLWVGIGFFLSCVSLLLSIWFLIGVAIPILVCMVCGAEIIIDFYRK